MKSLFALVFAATLLISGQATAQDSAAPKVVKMFPAQGETNVPVDITEIYIEFDRPMASTFSLYTKASCPVGVCYTSGYWKSKTVFAVKDVKLVAGTDYKMGVGNPETGHQQFGAEGVPVTPFYWTFTTEAAK